MSNSALAAGVRRLRVVVAPPRPADESDAQLLDAFATRRDEAAFAALVRRHGPMVAGVCRRVLHHEQDAEDAFQATFLVLARGAAALRKKTALASFLHGTAYRMALSVKRAAARRRKHEGQAPARDADDPAGELLWREVQTLLDEEIARLPDAYRSPFILCCLEGLSRAEAAQRLGLKEGTVSSRLAEARKRLSQRLARRGVELTAVLAAIALATPSASALSPMLIATTTLAALGSASAPVAYAAGSDGIGLLVLSKGKMAVLMLAVSLLAGAAAWICGSTATPQAEGPTSAPPTKHAKPQATVGMVRGRVLRPDGKPAANAAIIRRQWDEATGAVKETTVATTGTDGRFEVEHRDGTSLIASAPGFAPDWTGQEFAGGDLTLTLAERASIHGRLVNLEGKPIPGARVKVIAVKAPVRGNLNAVVEAFRFNPEWTWQALPRTLGSPVPQSTAEAKTDGDGRFALEGFGANRVLELRVEADGLESTRLHVILAADFDPKSVLPRPSERSGSMSPGYRPTVYGSEFTHALRPCQIITGVVTDETTGTPIPGVKIVGTARSIRQFNNAAWHDAVECVTDRDGRYRPNGMPKAKGRHLHVQAGDAPYLDRLIDVPDGETTYNPVRVDIKLARAVVIEGQLLDKATGKSVRGEAFYLLRESADLGGFLVNNPVYGQEYAVRPSGMHAFSDANGRFKLRAPPVPLVILARAARGSAARYTSIRVAEADRKYLHKPKEGEGEPTSRQSASIAKEEFFDTHVLIHPLHWENGYALVDPMKMDEIVKVAIRFDPGRTVQGKIVGPDGRPLIGVQAAGVQATGERGPTTFPTDTFSVYALDPSRPRTVYFRHAEKNLIGSVTLRGDEKEAPVVKMQPASVVVGRVLDAAGKPMAGMAISFQLTESRADGLIRQKLYGRSPSQATTDADGRFRLEGMFPGLEMEIYAGQPGRRVLAVGFGPLTLKPGEVRDMGERREAKPERGASAP
jgi:RNA polymerase sigma factor (sigma-70 family)